MQIKAIKFVSLEAGVHRLIATMKFQHTFTTFRHGKFVSCIFNFQIETFRIIGAVKELKGMLCINRRNLSREAFRFAIVV